MSKKNNQKRKKKESNKTIKILDIFVVRMKNGFISSVGIILFLECHEGQSILGKFALDNLSWVVIDQFSSFDYASEEKKYYKSHVRTRFDLFASLISEKICL